MYKIVDENTVESPQGFRFPKADGNRHYEAYKKWLKTGNIPGTSEDSLYEVVRHEAKPAKWIKDGEEDVLVQPMIAERWSDGLTTVYSEQEVPEQDGEPDPDFVYFSETNDDSWSYVPAEPFYWEVVEKELTEEQILQKNKQTISSAISFGMQLMIDFGAENMSMGITQDGMTSTVRRNMADIMLALQTGSLYDAIDEIKSLPQEYKDDKYITNQRLLDYLNRIERYLRISNTQSL
jgi:hypothetical protein